MTIPPRENPAGAGRLAAVCGLFAAAALARLWNLDALPLGWDDYNGLVGLSENSLTASVALARQVNPEGAPLYHVVQYLAHFLLGTSPAAMRLLSVAMGLATLPLVLASGTRVFGPRAGLVAAWCFAVSPLHIYHDQSIRNYPLFALLGAAALYTQIRVLQGGGKRWMAANWAANTLMVWTHLLGMFVVAAQGAAWLTMPRRRRGALVWGAGQAALLLPIASWLATMPHVPDTGYWHFHPPRALQVLAGITMPDFVRTTAELTPAGEPWRLSLFGLSTDSPEAVWLTGAGLFVCFAGGIAAWAAWRVFGLPRPVRAPNPDAVTALIIAAVLPGLALAAVSHLWRPMYYQRYLLCATLPLYVLAGGALSCLVRGRSLRAAAVSLLVLSGVQQLCLTLPCALRTPWREAGLALLRAARPGDQVLVGGFGDAWTNLRLLAVNMPPTNLSIAPAHSLDAAVIKSAMCLCPGGEGIVPPVPDGGSVWYVTNLLWGRTRLDGLEEHLRAVGLETRRDTLEGDEGIALVRIRRGASTPPYAEACARYWARVQDPGKTLSGLNLRELLDRAGITENREALLRQLRMVYDDGDLPESWENRLGLLEGMLEDEGVVRAGGLQTNGGADDGSLPALERGLREAMFHSDVRTAAALARQLRTAAAAGLKEHPEMVAFVDITAAMILGLNGDRREALDIVEKAVPAGALEDWRGGIIRMLAAGETARAVEEAARARAAVPSRAPDLPPPLLCAMGLGGWVVPAGEAALCGL